MPVGSAADRDAKYGDTPAAAFLYSAGKSKDLTVQIYIGSHLANKMCEHLIADLVPGVEPYVYSSKVPFYFRHDEGEKQYENSCCAGTRRFKTFGAIMAAMMPRMTITTMTSSNVKPRMRVITPAGVWLNLDMVLFIFRILICWVQRAGVGICGWNRRSAENSLYFSRNPGIHVMAFSSENEAQSALLG